MRAGILHHLAQGNISIHADQEKPLPQLGTDGLRTLIDSKSDPNNPGLGATWVRGESNASQRNQQIAPGKIIPQVFRRGSLLFLKFMIQFIGSKENVSFSILGANIKMSGYQQADSSSDSSSDSSFGD